MKKNGNQVVAVLFFDTRDKYRFIHLLAWAPVPVLQPVPVPVQWQVLKAVLPVAHPGGLTA